MSQDSSVRRSPWLFASMLLAIGLLAGVLLLVSRARAAPGVPPVALHPPRNVVTATLTTTVSVTYDEPIDPSTVTSRTFAVHGMQSGLVTATHGVINGNTIIVTPARLFHQGELVYAIATTRTLNVTGTGPISGTQWQFNAGRVISRCAAFVEDVAASSALTDVRVGSAAWGDYDNDGDLDILLTGQDLDSTPLAKIYQNTGSGFSEVYTGTLTNVRWSSVAWGDYDNDGDLDILLAGYDSSNNRTSKVYQNTGSGFSEVYPGSLTGVGNSSVAWGDYDNDGDLDILLTGHDGTSPVAQVYQNTGSGFSEVYAGSLTGVDDGSVAWGDYDNDGDLDILLTGSQSHIAEVYENTGNGFTEVYPGSLTGVDGSSVAWGDYDNDGDLDILLTGVDDDHNRVAQVYQNMGSGFSEVYTGTLTGVVWGSVAWGDYDNDGDLDILLTGHAASTRVAKIYQNIGGGFSEVYPGSLVDVDDSSVAWGDYDDDGDLDILLTGRDSGGSPITKIYRNEDCRVDLALTKHVDPDPVVAGTAMTYTLVITNHGNVSATHVVLSDTLPVSATLQTFDQTDDSQAEFDAGIHDNTRWIDPRPQPYVHGDEWLEIDDTLLATGVFTSRVFDAGNMVSWTGLAWTPRRPTWKPLPDGGGTEAYYARGEVNMTGNRVLLHGDALVGFTISDTSGFDNHGICPAAGGEGCPTVSPGGRFNGALTFDGTLSQTVVISDAHDPIRYALEMWVWVPSGGITDTSFILRTDVLSGTQHHTSHLLGIRDGHFQHTVYDGAYRTITSTTPVTPNRWYHLVGMAQSGGDLELYVNGEREARMGGLGALWMGGDQYRLGSSYGPTGTTRYFSGRLDEVAVYSRTLSSGEVRDHYLRGALRIGFEVRSCDDAACSGESWSGLYSEQSNAGLYLPSVTFSPTLADNRYFQYRATLETDDPDYTPALRRVEVEPDHRIVYPSQGNCSAGAHAFLCELGELAAGGVVTVEAHANVHPSARFVITNTASVTATGEMTPTDNTATVTTTAVSEVDIDVQKYDDDDPDGDGYPEWHYGAADPVNPGFPLTYTLQVHNGGPSTAWDVVITDTLPITVTGVAAQGGWATCDFTTHTITCTTDSLARHTWPHLIVTGTAPTREGWITNTAWITAQASTVYTTSHVSDTQTTLITPLADLLVVKTADPNPVDPGETLTFTVVVTNGGPSPAINVTVTDTLQAGLEAHAIGGNWSCSDVEANVIACTLPASLTVGASDSFRITTTVPVSGLVGNVAVVTSDTYDPEEENNVAYAYAAVRPVADLHVLKADVEDPVNAAAPLTYTITVSNSHYVDAGAREGRMALENAHPIHIPIGGRARPYPSSIYLSSMEGLVRDVTVTLHNLHHTYPADIEALLVGPGGRSVVLMANAGGGADAAATLTFHDGGALMPVSGTLTSTDTYRPTNYGLTGALPVPAPPGPYGGSLSTFDGASPNGWWRLYVYDTFGSDGGEITGGWSLTLTTRTTDTVTLSDTLPSGLTGVSVEAPAGWRRISSTPLVYEADTLPVQSHVVFTITATAPITGGVITNTAAITSTTADFWPASNEDTITTTITAVADLLLEKAAHADQVPIGTPLTYTLTVSNAGPSPLPDPILVTDTLPGGLTDVSAPPMCDLTALPVITCTLGGLGVGDAADVTITATAPLTRGVITNTAGVIAPVADPGPLQNTDSITVAVGDVAIVGLVATNDSPTVIGTPTLLGATVAQGSNVNYAWAFGDGATGSGDLISHTYPMTGTYTAIVTATNSASQMTATTEVEIINRYRICLPLVMNSYVAAPDLVVDSIVATADAVTVTISNQGDAPVTRTFENEFWVDVYIDPDPNPTAVNQTWAHLGSQGLVWGVTQDALPLDPGETLVLTTGRDHDGAYFWPQESVITWTLPAGTEVWAQVDSAHQGSPHGAVLEDHEIVGAPYAEGGNILGPVFSTGGSGVGTSPAPRGQWRPPPKHHLPPRP